MDSSPSQRQRPSSWEIFDQQAANYDAWFDTPRGAAIFASELNATRPLLAGAPRPWLEVGVGTGRFAAALGIDLGIDPALGALRLAQSRGIRTAVAVGEELPLRTASCGLVAIIMTLCFVEDPRAVLRETARVLRPDGRLVAGLVPAESSWGQHYQRLAASDHPYYSGAHFYRLAETLTMMSAVGLRPTRSRSTLFWPPDAEPSMQPARSGSSPSAGFVAVLATNAAVEPTSS
jgi:ubiquinone/menaquinone biosynthesis C-methylase UbiE